MLVETVFARHDANDCGELLESNDRNRYLPMMTVAFFGGVYTASEPIMLAASLYHFRQVLPTMLKRIQEIPKWTSSTSPSP
jgi:hypothetical protein